MLVINLLSETYNFHQYNICSEGSKEKEKDPRLDHKKENNITINTACYLSSQGELEQLQSLYVRDFDLNQSDYDGRTPLHIACCENKMEIVIFLIETCNCDINVYDRWKNTPLDDCEREGNHEIKKYLVEKNAKKFSELS